MFAGYDGEASDGVLTVFVLKKSTHTERHALVPAPVLQLKFSDISVSGCEGEWASGYTGVSGRVKERVCI